MNCCFLLPVTINRRSNTTISWGRSRFVITGVGPKAEASKGYGTCSTGKFWKIRFSEVRFLGVTVICSIVRNHRSFVRTKIFIFKAYLGHQQRAQLSKPLAMNTCLFKQQLTSVQDKWPEEKQQSVSVNRAWTFCQIHVIFALSAYLKATGYNFQKIACISGICS